MFKPKDNKSDKGYNIFGVVMGAYAWFVGLQYTKETIEKEDRCVEKAVQLSKVSFPKYQSYVSKTQRVLAKRNQLTVLGCTSATLLIAYNFLQLSNKTHFSSTNNQSPSNEATFRSSHKPG